MNRSVVRLFDYSVIAVALCTAGCFNEPESAEKTIPAESRLYLQDKGLSDLAKVDLSKVGDYLNLDRNSLTNVDPVAKLVGLKWLRLNQNRLTSLPDLKSLVALRRIYLKNNAFSAVPETLKDLPALTDVELSGNPIKSIPDWLVAKPGLKNVSLNRTQLTKLPGDLSGWKTLKSLQLGDLSLSAEEMARIRAQLPKVAIVF